MKNINTRGFEGFYRKYSEKDLKKMMDEVYDALHKQFKSEISLGYDGCKELLGALLLFKYDKKMEEKITIGICKLFQNRFDCLDFSEYMEGFIEYSEITMEEWIDIYDYLERNHKWIENHRCV